MGQIRVLGIGKKGWIPHRVKNPVVAVRHDRSPAMKTRKNVGSGILR